MDHDGSPVPTDATPDFTVYNSYHSALPAAPGESMGSELEAEILDVCEMDCDAGVLRVWGRPLNTGNTGIAAGVGLALYGQPGDVLPATATTNEATRRR
jgi:hypothetical protein